MLRNLRSLRPWALLACVALCVPHVAAAQHTATDPHKASREPRKKGEQDRVDMPSATVQTAEEPSKGKPSKGAGQSGREKVDNTDRTVLTGDSTKKPPHKGARTSERADTATTTTAQGGREKARSQPTAPSVMPVKKPAQANAKPAVVRVAPAPTAPVQRPRGRPAERPR